MQKVHNTSKLVSDRIKKIGHILHRGAVLLTVNHIYISIVNCDNCLNVVNILQCGCKLNHISTKSCKEK
jgi:hypothetical protein